MTTRENQRLAILVIIVTVFSLALGDALIKGASAKFTLWQIFVLRSVAVAPVLIGLMRWGPVRASLVPGNIFWTLIRSLMLTFMWVTYYLSLAHVDLSIAAAAYYTLPLFITLFAAAFLGDAIGAAGWSAVVVGFVGVLLVLEPRPEDFNWYALLPVISAVLYALAMILTRSRCRTENILVLSLWLNLAMLVTGAVATASLGFFAVLPEHIPGQEFLLGSWTPLGPGEIVALVVLSVTILIGSVGAAYAYQNGRPATIATFDFAYVAFAVGWGMVLFKEAPSTSGWVGIALIVSAGMLAVRSRANAAERGAASDTPSERA